MGKSVEEIVLAYSDDELFGFCQFVVKCNYWLHIESMDYGFFDNAMYAWSNTGKIENFRANIDLIINNEEHKDKRTLLSLFLEHAKRNTN
jgi:hypothetical protein